MGQWRSHRSHGDARGLKATPLQPTHHPRPRQALDAARVLVEETGLQGTLEPGAGAAAAGAAGWEALGGRRSCC